MISKESPPNIETVKPKRNKYKGGANIEFNSEHLGEIYHSFNLYLELAMQIISNDQTVRSITIQDLKEFNSQSLFTQIKKGEQLVLMKPAI